MKTLPTWVEIDLDLLEKNLDAIRARVGAEVGICMTVKADAYGHGAVQVAQAAQSHVAMFGVATLDEATELKEAGVRSPILVLSPVLDTEIDALAAGGFDVTVSSRSFAEALSAWGSAHGHTFGVHVEVDTGMGRTGVLATYALEEIPRIAAMPSVRLDGVYTHFPVSDSDEAFTLAQVATFTSLIDNLRAAGVNVPLVHSANSAAVADIPTSHMSLVRPGLLAYGLHPCGPQPEDVSPILSWKSRLARVRRIPKGSSISYGRDFVTGRDSLIGVVPVGYGHGFPFSLSNGGEVLVAGRRVPIVGRVTMDMTMVDLTGLPDTPAVGEVVTLVGGQGSERIDFHEIAGRAGTLCYEVMCGISKRVPRTYFRGGRVTTYKSLLGIIPNHLAV